MIRALAIVGWVAGCAAPPPPVPPAPPVPKVDVRAPWHILEEDRQVLVLRHTDRAEGVRVQLAPGADGRGLGVTPVHAGRALERRSERGPTPAAFAPPWTQNSAVYVESQGPDLLVRLEGPPIRAWSDHPKAPADPLLSWVRLRLRADGSWRIALRGLVDVTLPGVTAVAEAGEARRLETSYGVFAFRGEVPGLQSALHQGTWIVSNRGALAHLEPYPQWGFTWAPTNVSP